MTRIIPTAAISACIFSMGALASTGPATADQITTGSAVQTMAVGEPLPHWDRLKPGTRRYLRYRIEDGRRIAMDIWSRTLSFDPDPATGEPRLHITQQWNGATLPMERTVDSWFEIGTFRPLSHRTTRVARGQTTEAAFLFSPDAVRGDASVPGNSQAALDIPTPDQTFNFETDMELLSALPWREGYAARINFYHPGGDAPQYYAYRVTGSESLSFGGRPVESWAVDIDYGALGDARFWIDKDTHAVLKVATRGPDIPGVLYKILLPDE